MASSYDPKSIEPKWRKYWEENKTFRTEDPSGLRPPRIQSGAGSSLGKGRTESRGKFYALIEFPYPSGEGLHVGHPRSYTAMDIVVRKRRMEGYDVLYPIGFDAFGLPAENYAIKTKTHPAITTQKNIAHFTDQLKSLGFSFDWDRAVDTTDPEYYKWTQWIFLQLYKHGLAYKTEIAINWCLNCKIGLANEEVIQGRCERCGGPVEKRLKSQWMLKITEYADRLLSDLDTTQYLEKIKTQQREWIGKSSGVNWKQKVKGMDIAFESYDSVPQTFMAQTYAVIAPEHRLLPELVKGTEHEKSVMEFVEHIKRKKLEQGFEEEKEMEGIFTGRYLDNPFGTGDLPIWVASFVVADYGTGFVNCSAHDERDFVFAKKYGIPLRPVMFPSDPVEAEKVKNLEYCYHHDPEAIMAAPEKFAGRKWGEVREDLIAYVQEKGLGYPKTQYKLRDWVFSRQRYWGEPIPLVYCESCASKAFPAPKHTFMIKNPSAWTRLMNGTKRVKGLANGKHSPEVAIEEGDVLDFHNPDRDAHLYGRVTKVHAFGSIKELAQASSLHGLLFDTDRPLTADELTARYASYDPEYSKLIQKNGMRVFEFELENVGNRINPGWIPLPDDQLPLKLPEVPMYEPTDTGESPLANLTDWINVKCPQCGGPAKRETDTMPNWAGSSWYFLRYIDPKDSEELASMDKLKYWMEVDWYNGGMEHTTLHLLYSRFWNKFLYDIGAVPTSEPYMKRTSHGMILGEGGMKMSKSKGNVVNPDDIVARYGADTLRLYEMFMGPFDQAIPWDSKGVEGCHRFLQRVWKLVTEKTSLRPVNASEGEARTDAEVPSPRRREPLSTKSPQPPLKKGEEFEDDPKLTKLLHKTIKKVGEDIERMGFNTAVSACMILLNEAQEHEKVSQKFSETFVTILSPFVPFMAEELWSSFGHTESVSHQPWPAYDPALVKDDEITLVVQVNGKVRDSLTVPADITKEEALKLAYEREDVKKWLEGKKVAKEVFVPGKLVSIVAA